MGNGRGEGGGPKQRMQGLANEAGGLDRPSDRVGEDKFGILPRAAHSEPFGTLGDPMPLHSCRLPIDARDVDEELREVGEAQPTGAVITHRRCGATFRIAFP